MFSSFSPFAKRSRLSATTLQRRSAVAPVLLELCGVISTLGSSWNGRRDGLRSGSAGLGYCHQQDLFTVDIARSRGVGRALIEGVCVRAKAGGASRVYWNTGEANASARALYDKVATLTKTESSLTLRWREMDSNFQYASTSSFGFRKRPCASTWCLRFSDFRNGWRIVLRRRPSGRRCCVEASIHLKHRRRARSDSKNLQG